MDPKESLSILIIIEWESSGTSNIEVSEVMALGIQMNQTRTLPEKSLETAAGLDVKTPMKVLSTEMKMSEGLRTLGRIRSFHQIHASHSSQYR